ncbi:MAG: peptidase M3, partial [Betaproteobacteria bacterium]|nr:peptidase M3 [Betaproteobacteria bacterium]
MLESSASENDPGHSDNPLLMRWEAAFAMPPFDRLRTEHFMPAFEFAMKEHRLELEAITHNPERPDFQNTMVALERCGENLQRVMNVFYNLTSSHTSAELQAIEREMAPRLAAHFNAMMLDPKLFERVDDLHRRADHDELDAESRRMLARWHLDFVRSGAKLAEKERLRFAAITEELATLYTDFSQNVLHDESSFTMILRSDDELSGLPDFVRAAARQAAIERGVDGDDAHVITLSRSSVTPFMTFSERRELRQNLWQAWCARGEHAGARDNRSLIVAILKCRHELATLLGYPDYASYALEDSMAGNPQAALGLLERVWEPARQRAEAEKREMEALARKQGQVISLEAHDWHFWAER